MIKVQQLLQNSNKMLYNDLLLFLFIYIILSFKVFFVVLFKHQKNTYERSLNINQEIYRKEIFNYKF